MSLSDIRQPIETELKTFGEHFRSAMRSKVPYVDTIARYLVKQKGKQIRPVLVLLSAKACGGITEATYRGATLVEILHTATLIHDDVVDGSDTRRGLASINAVWKNKIAVLMGDYLYAKGLLLSVEKDDYRFLQIISTAVKRMSEGEIHQIARSRSLDIDEAGYMKIIGDKTASLLATCCEIGTASVSQDEALRDRLKIFGEYVGMAFQIRDDLLDYIGRRSITGKPTGLDLSEKKLTLPMIHALSTASRKDAKHILSLIRNGVSGAKALGEVLDFVESHGGIEYSIRKAEHYATLASASLTPIPDSPARKSLLDFVRFVVERMK